MHIKLLTYMKHFLRYVVHKTGVEGSSTKKNKKDIEKKKKEHIITKYIAHSYVGVY